MTSMGTIEEHKNIYMDNIDMYKFTGGRDVCKYTYTILTDVGCYGIGSVAGEFYDYNCDREDMEDIKYSDQHEEIGPTIPLHVMGTLTRYGIISLIKQQNEQERES